MPSVTAFKAQPNDIQPLRQLFLQENNFQIRYDACHQRGWADPYLLALNGITVGYGAIKGRDIPDRDTVFEFFVLRPFRNESSHLFREFVAASGAKYIECQSNDLQLSAMLYEYANSIQSDTTLFEDHTITHHAVEGLQLRLRRDEDEVFQHSIEPVGDYVLELKNGGIVATGGFFLHYNVPFADLYMEVREDCRRRYFGTVLVQELKKSCYLAGRVPAARCSTQNIASRATLLKAGMRVCGFMLLGTVTPAAS